MLKFILLALIVDYCWADRYDMGSGQNAPNSYNDLVYRLYKNSKYREPSVKTRRRVEVRPMITPRYPSEPKYIDVPNDDQPITLHFRTQSARVNVQQSHIPAKPGHVERTSSEDEPHRVVHEVIKPVIQEVREIIQPYRRVVQQIEPVIEDIRTIVAKNERNSREYARYDSNNAGGYESNDDKSIPERYLSANNDLSYGNAEKSQSNVGYDYGTGRMGNSLMYGSGSTIHTTRGIPVYRSIFKV